MELFLLGINGLLLMAVWKFMLRKTILDHHRDKLFDLRDKLRATYVERGWDLDSPMYRKLRSLTNGYLRFTEDFAFVPFTILEHEVKGRPAVLQSLAQHLEREFSTKDKELAMFVEQYRAEARLVMTGYMICSSAPMFALCLLIWPVVIATEVIKLVSRGALMGLIALATRAAVFQAAATSSFAQAKGAVAGTFIIPSVVEEYSYRIGIAPNSPAPAC